MGLFDWLTGDSSSENIKQKLEKYRAKICSEGAKAGDPEQQYIYGVGLLEGKYTSKNQNEGFNYLLKSAQQGYLQAEYYLGLIFANGLHGYAKDITKASNWLLSAAEHNPNSLSEHGQIYYNAAIACLGGLYASGNQMPRLGQTIINLLGTRTNDVQCTYYLGKIFSQGASENSINPEYAGYWYSLMIENDIRESIEWSKKIGKQVYLPVEEFDGKPADFTQVVKNIKKLVSSNIPEAQYALGFALFWGWRLIEINQNAGIKIMKISAHNGNKSASEFLLDLQHKCERDSNQGNQAAANLLPLILNKEKTIK